MSELIWLNGEVLPLSDARIGVEDRGFQFADGVYEVIRLYNGKAFTLSEHLDRLTREISRFIEKSPVRDGMIYLQITRGVSPRNHIFAESKPTILFYARPLP